MPSSMDEVYAKLLGSHLLAEAFPRGNTEEFASTSSCLAQPGSCTDVPNSVGPISTP